MRWLRAGLLSSALCLSLPAAAGPPAPVATAILKLPRGFIDDPLALSADGRTLYYVATDGAGWAELQTAALPEPNAAPAAAVELKPDATLSGAPLYPVRLLLLPGERVLVVEREPESRTPKAMYGQILSIKEPRRSRDRLGPADDIVLTQVSGRPQILLYSSASPEKGGELRLRLYDAATHKPGVQRALRIQPGQGAIALGPPGRDLPPALPLALVDQYQTLLARQPGEYDKKTDLRQPDRLVAYDLITGKTKQSAPVQNPSALLELAALRDRYPGETAFLVHVPEHQRIELIHHSGGDKGDAFLGVRLPLRWPRAQALYEATTLRYQIAPDPAGRSFASQTVDPVNEAAVARQKADADIIDLCDINLESGLARLLLSVPGSKRRSTWVAAALPGYVRFALLRKHKGFARGGAELEIFDAAEAGPPPSAR